MSANPQRGIPLPRGVYSPADSRTLRGMVRERLVNAYPKSNAATAESEFRVTVSGSFSKGAVVRHSPEFHIDIVAVYPQSQQDENTDEVIKQGFRALADKLCEEHPAISTDKSIFGGIPHIKDVRLSVGDILAKLYVYGNIQDILETYSPQVSEEQVKEAIAYAQDFLEMACDSNQISEVDD